jgi:hypothetical protein
MKRLRTSGNRNLGNNNTSDDSYSGSRNNSNNMARANLMNTTFDQSFSAFDFKIDESLKGVTFGSDNVTYNNGEGLNYELGAENIAQIVDENGNIRHMTFDEYVQITTQSNETSFTDAPEMIEIRDYMEGTTNDVPPLLKQLADEREIENPTRADFDELLKEKLNDHLGVYLMTVGSYEPESEQTKPAQEYNSIASSNAELVISSKLDTKGHFDNATL